MPSSSLTRLGVVPVCHDDRLAPAGCAALRELRGVPLVRRAVGALARSGVLDEIVVVTPPALVEEIGALLARLPIGSPPVQVIAVQENGSGLRLRAVLRMRRPAAHGVVVVHDPLFPLSPAALVRAVVAALDAESEEGAAAVIPVRPVTDTLKRVDEDEVITSTVDRDGYRMVYSPQAYRAGALVAAVEPASEDTLREVGADSLPRLIQSTGGRLRSVLAPGGAFRVATADDLVIAEAMLHVGADLDDEPAARAH